MRKSTLLIGVVGLNVLLTSACSSDSDGAANAGGASSTSASSGGATGTSGSTGGATGVSGNTGGATATNVNAHTGGVTGAGGATGVGGVTGIGGVTGAGGITGFGGKSGTGGETGVGGDAGEEVGDAGTFCEQVPSLAMGDPNFRVSSDAFGWCLPIPAEYTCDQKMFSMGSSFGVSWTAGPSGTASYGVVFKDLSVLARTASTDPSYNRGYHWVMWDIPATVRSLPEDMTGGALSTDVPGARQWGPFNDYAFFGPCPNFDPSAEPINNDSYAVVIYALPFAKSEIAAPTTGISVVRQLDDYFKLKALAVAEYRGTSNAHASMLPDGGPMPATAKPCPTDGTPLAGCLAGP